MACTYANSRPLGHVYQDHETISFDFCHVCVRPWMSLFVKLSNRAALFTGFFSTEPLFESDEVMSVSVLGVAPTRLFQSQTCLPNSVWCM